MEIHFPISSLYSSAGDDLYSSRPLVPNLSGSVDQWWRERRGFMHVATTCTNGVLCAPRFTGHLSSIWSQTRSWGLLHQITHELQHDYLVFFKKRCTLDVSAEYNQQVSGDDTATKAICIMCIATLLTFLTTTCGCR